MEEEDPSDGEAVVVSVTWVIGIRRLVLSCYRLARCRSPWSRWDR